MESALCTVFKFLPAVLPVWVKLMSAKLLQAGGDILTVWAHCFYMDSTLSSDKLLCGELHYFVDRVLLKFKNSIQYTSRKFLNSNTWDC